MRQLGAKPVATDFHVFLVEGAVRLGLHSSLLKVELDGGWPTRPKKNPKALLVA